ncbi:hypothetical protein I4U23_017067 [Adineta vaga]|nr:hypothetical protein I4U23_017067 [Adineta vaga]
MKIYILICIKEVNGFFHSTFRFDCYSQSLQVFALGLYPSAAFINHSCTPNMGRMFIDKNSTEFQRDDLVFFAAYSVKKNKELFISYVKRKWDLYLQNQMTNVDEIINSQIMGKQQLKDEYFFNCDCIRCVNESKGELDKSFMNLIKELQCTKSKCQGWLIPSFEKHHMYCEACQMLQ